ncbi:MAG: hypothetical protein NTV86_17055 [Planctomycetota bacterium]|nr:hypothetical protein [Planctomycetota bacterium]
MPASATEGNGVLAGQGMVTVWPAPTSNLRVTLASSDTTEVTVPATVTILAGQTSATFDLTVINDTYRAGSQIATISATAASYPTGLGTIAIHDNETATLTVTMPTSAGEGAGMLTGAGTVKVSAAPGSNVTVNLTSSDTSELMVPATVTILAGQTSATFDVTIVDDTVIDGTKTVAVVAHVENWTDGTASMNVLDNESRALEVSSMGGRDYENQGVQAGAGRVSLSGPLEPAADLVVTLASSDLTELTVPATVTIPAGRASAAFDLTPVDDTECDGGQTVTVTASAEGFAGGSNCTTVLDNEVHHFAFDTIASSKTAGVPFFVAVEARDIDNSTITVFTGTVGLSGSGDGGAISVTPPSDMAFVAGRWRGYVALNRVDTNLVLTANDGAGHVGISNAFNLVAPSEVHGSTWTDLDGDGLRDVGEPALPGWMVYLDNNNNGQWDASELSQVTDADGRYSFAYLAAGTYAVREVIPSGWIQTCPGGTGTKAVTLALGQVASGIDIGNWVVSPGEIQGTQWNDLDGDGVRDAGEPPLAGRTVYLDTNRNGQWDAGEPSQVTDTNGQYAFTYLPAGTYSVGEVTPPGWRQTLPSGAGTTNLIVNGGFETGSFAGWTYPDMGTGVFLVDNGSYDPTSSDGPLSPYNGVFNALTDLGGAGPLEFHSQEGWSVPVAPGSCVHVVRGPAPGYCGPVPAGATDYGFEDIGGPNSAFLRYGDYDDIVLRVYDNNPSVAFLIWVTASYSNSILSNGQPLMQLPSFFGAVDPPLAIPIAPVGASVLYQDVAIPAGATAALSWVDMIRNHAAAFQDPDQEYRVEVRNTADQVLATVFSTNSGDPLLQDWTPRNADLSAFAGQTVRIAFVEQHSMAPLNVHIDDVAVTGTGGNWPIPVTLAGGQVVTGKDFGNRCMVSVNPKTTDDATPSLTGTVDDPTATIAVTVGGQTYPAVNHGDGTWTLADDVVSPALGRGVYDVQVTATDATLNAGSDATTNELIVYKLMADANLDGEVGVEDFGLLKENFGLDGLANAWGVGDFNGDGEVGVEDFGLLKENFGLDEPLTPTPLMAAYGPTGAGVFPNAADAADAAEDDKLDILDTLADLAPVLDLTVV